MNATQHCTCGGAHPAGAAFYVTVVDAGRVGYLAGPFASHPAALAMVEPSRRIADTLDPWAHFYAFGTAALPPGTTTPGTLNARLGVQAGAA